jgi:hypothetical protein
VVAATLIVSETRAGEILLTTLQLNTGYPIADPELDSTNGSMLVSCHDAPGNFAGWMRRLDAATARADANEPYVLDSGDKLRILVFDQ